MSPTSTIRGLAALIPMIMTLTGCAREGADPTVAAAADLQRTLELDGALDLSGPGGGLAPGARAPAALACDEAPEVVSASLCGHEYAAEARYAWADCAVELPGERPDVTTSGTFDVVRSASGEGDCAGPAELEESAVFEVEAALPRGRRAALSGAITARSRRDLEAGTFQRSATITATRAVYDEDGELVRAAAMEGALEVAVRASEEGPERVTEGTITLATGDEDEATISLVGVVHRPLAGCAWPTGGTLIRALPEGERHTLVFGPGCGEGTLDGEAVELDELQQGGRRGRGGGGRPF